MADCVHENPFDKRAAEECRAEQRCLWRAIFPLFRLLFVGDEEDGGYQRNDGEICEKSNLRYSHAEFPFGKSFCVRIIAFFEVFVKCERKKLCNAKNAKFLHKSRFSLLTSVGVCDKIPRRGRNDYHG